MSSNNLETFLVEKLIHLVLLALVAIVLATYVVPAVSTRLELVLKDAVNVQAK